MSDRKQPVDDDVLALAKAMHAFDVEYAVIGGMAMALHGYPRMTKDIDFLLPVDAGNNQRLLRALESIPSQREAVAALRPEWMDKGHSTALESDGNVAVDLLYVAASQSYEDLRAHVVPVNLRGVIVNTLDVDGLLLTKKTNRYSDVADRIKLERHRNALREREKQGGDSFGRKNGPKL
jgi:hypothetical protein